MKKNITKKSIAIIIITMMMALSLAGCGGNGKTDVSENSNKQEVIELKFHHHDPPTSYLGRTLQSWVDEIEAKTNGKVKFTMYPGASLGAANTAFDMVSNGIADVGWSFVGFYPNKFPMTEAITLPMLGIDDGIVGSKVIWEMYENTDYLKDEYKGVKVLTIHTHTDVPLSTSKKEIKTIADMQGLKMRVPGGPPTELMKAVGATPINMPPGELYTSIEKGVIDGYMIDWQGIPAFKLTEITDHYLDARIYVAPFFIIMNENKWNSLPDDVKAVFEELGGAYAAEKIGREAYPRDQIIQQVLDGGGTIHELSEAEYAKWKEKADQVAAQWIKMQEEAGRPGQAVYDKLIETIDKVRTELGYK